MDGLFDTPGKASFIDVVERDAPQRLTERTGFVT
jgi:hypothetical protein